MIMKFKAGDLVIDRASPGAPRKGMIYKVTTGPKGRQWYELQFFGSGETVEWVDWLALQHLEHYKAETNESTA